jgi:hypothetical protein
MKQEYHSNASTNVHVRLEISKSNLTNLELANKYNISEPTVSKWKNRENFEDKSSRPHTIHYALNDARKILPKPFMAMALFLAYCSFRLANSKAL